MALLLVGVERVLQVELVVALDLDRVPVDDVACTQMTRNLNHTVLSHAYLTVNDQPNPDPGPKRRIADIRLHFRGRS